MRLDPEPTILDGPDRLWWYEITEVTGALAARRVKGTLRVSRNKVAVGDHMISAWCGQNGEWHVYDLLADKSTGYIAGIVRRRVTDEERAELIDSQEFHQVSIRT